MCTFCDNCFNKTKFYCCGVSHFPRSEDQAGLCYVYCYAFQPRHWQLKIKVLTVTSQLLLIIKVILLWEFEQDQSLWKSFQIKTYMYVSNKNRKYFRRLTVHLIVKLVFVLFPTWGWLGVDGTEQGISQRASGEKSPLSPSFSACNL